MTFEVSAIPEGFVFHSVCVSVRTIATILALVLLVPFAAAQWKTDHVSPFVASSLVPPVTISRHTLPSIDVGYSLYDLRGFIDDCICNLLYQY